MNREAAKARLARCSASAANTLSQKPIINKGSLGPAIVPIALGLRSSVNLSHTPAEAIL
jgi:hypothetical protein